MVWHRYTTAGKFGSERPLTHVELGPGDEGGLGRRLLGELNGQRILEIGTGRGHSAIAMANAGARVVAIDANANELAKARIAAEAAEVSVEMHEADSAELAFLHADIFDAVVSVHSLAAAPNLGRVFRQVHRVLKPDRPIVFSLPHPFTTMTRPEKPARLEGRYGDEETLGRGMHLTHRRTISEIFTLLGRSDFRVDTMIEPMGSDEDGPLPVSLILRARKVGI